jgi:hypothetical protein
MSQLQRPASFLRRTPNGSFLSELLDRSNEAIKEAYWMTMRAQTAALQDGVVDVKTPGGWNAVVGMVPIDILDRALALCPSDSQSYDPIQEIDPRFVLACAWQESRLKEARQRAEEGIDALMPMTNS